MFSETTREDKLRKALDSTVSIKKLKGLKGKREIDDIQQANRSLPATITIEKKQFILKLSPLDKDKSPIFPKCSHNAKNKINRPLLKMPLDNDIEDNMANQYAIEDSHTKNLPAKSKEKGKPKHHNKFIYYTRDNEETTQTKNNKKHESKETKSSQSLHKTKSSQSPHKSSHTTIPSFEKQFAHKLHHTKPHKITPAKDQKVYQKEKTIDYKPTSKIKDPEGKICSQTNNDINVQTQTKNMPHTTRSTESDLQNTDDLTITQEPVNTGQFDYTPNPELGIDIFISTIKPYFDELHKQYTQAMELGYTLKDNENDSIQNRREYFLQSKFPNRIYNKFFKPNIIKIGKADKSKRFLMNEDVGKSIDVDNIPALNILPINCTLP